MLINISSSTQPETGSQASMWLSEHTLFAVSWGLEAPISALGPVQGPCGVRMCVWMCLHLCVECCVFAHMCVEVCVCVYLYMHVECCVSTT